MTPQVPPHPAGHERAPVDERIGGARRGSTLTHRPVAPGRQPRFREDSGIIQTLQPTASLRDCQPNGVKDSESGERAPRAPELPPDLSTSVPKLVRYSARWSKVT